jgi:uncharacterized protein (UPF0548 family)
LAAAVFSLFRPPDASIARLLRSQAELPFSFAEVGVTRGDARSRLRRGHHRIELGTGAATFHAAVSALRDWTMYKLPWTEVFPADTPIQPGAVFATVVRHIGFWSVNPCRVVYHHRTAGHIHSEAFAIGTLPAHSERGEERFQIEWRQDDDSVWFEILVFAEPRHWLARAGAPFAYRLQQRFRVEAGEAMRRAAGSRTDDAH